LFEKTYPASANIGQILQNWKRHATIFGRMEEIGIFRSGFVLFLTEVLHFILIFSLPAPHGRFHHLCWIYSTKFWPMVSQLLCRKVSGIFLRFIRVKIKVKDKNITHHAQF
jgi:hypothetical protein